MARAVEAIERVAEMLAAESVTPLDAARRLGPAFEDPGHGLPLRVTPGDEAFSTVSIASHSDSPAVAHVEITFREASRPLLAELATAFGAYLSPPRVHADSPNRVVFRHARSGPAANITLIATLGPGPIEPPAAPVESVTLRCDPVD